MITDFDTVFETMAWKNAENPQMPDDVRRFTDRTLAKDYARAISKEYGLVEVNRLEVNPDDAMDLYGGYLLAVWTNGRRTA